jgi:hypothetical protein
MSRSLIDRFVYSITKKPKHYIEVRNPPKTAAEKLSRPQDARQVQYNRWSKRYKIYSGSYLPENDKRLLKKGWEDTTSITTKNNKSTNPSKFYRRKSSNQWVRNDKDHWHWYNWWLKDLNHKTIKKQENMYYDEYGAHCKKGSPESHLKGRN